MIIKVAHQRFSIHLGCSFNSPIAHERCSHEGTEQEAQRKREKRPVLVGGWFSQFCLHCPRPRPQRTATLFQDFPVTPTIMGLGRQIHLRLGPSVVSLGPPVLLPPRIDSFHYLIPRRILLPPPRTADAAASSSTYPPIPLQRFVCSKTPIKLPLVSTAPLTESSLEVSIEARSRYIHSVASQPTPHSVVK